LVLAVVALAKSDKLFDGVKGVYVKAVVTSLDVSVIAPVRVLNEVTLPALLKAAGSHAIPSHTYKEFALVLQ
jgi:alkyl sulfatase BDS1-like metallo-beta-lactamase superfamily hydrolase